LFIDYRNHDLGGMITVMAAIQSMQLPPLTRKSMAELIAKAKRMGVAPEDYARSLIEDSLAFQREAEQQSFAKIMKPVRDAAGEVSDEEVVGLVKAVRSETHKTVRRSKR
jgi:hypothetical protein